MIVKKIAFVRRYSRLKQAEVSRRVYSSLSVKGNIQGEFKNGMSSNYRMF